MGSPRCLVQGRGGRPGSFVWARRLETGISCEPPQRSGSLLPAKDSHSACPLHPHALNPAPCQTSTPTGSSRCCATHVESQEIAGLAGVPREEAGPRVAAADEPRAGEARRGRDPPRAARRRARPRRRHRRARGPGRRARRPRTEGGREGGEARAPHPKRTRGLASPSPAPAPPPTAVAAGAAAPGVRDRGRRARRARGLAPGTSRARASRSRRRSSPTSAASSSCRSGCWGGRSGAPS